MRLINLLPKSKQQELRYGVIARNMVKVLWVSVFSFGVVAAAQLGVKFVLESRLKAMDGEIAAIQQQMNKDENAVLKNKVKTVNDTIADYKQLADAAPKWSKVLRTLAVLPPPEVQITSFTVDPAKKIATVRGQSPTRDLVLKFYDNLKNESNFTNVINPFENIAKARDVSFQFTFTIKEELLK